jgi:hypothetical protein
LKWKIVGRSRHIHRGTLLRQDTEHNSTRVMAPHSYIIAMDVSHGSFHNQFHSIFDDGQA